MKPFYVKNESVAIALEVMLRAVHHGAVFINDYPTFADYIGVDFDMELHYNYLVEDYGDNAQELTIEQVRKLYPLPFENKEVGAVKESTPNMHIDEIVRN